MTDSGQLSASPTTGAGRAKRLKAAGVAVLLLGIAGAALVFWLGARRPDPRDDLSMLGYNRAENRQMAQLYGKWGTMIDGLQDDLNNPGNQATLIVVVAVGTAFGCFYFADQLEGEGVANGDEPPQA
jgi:hypothetical protein